MYYNQEKFDTRFEWGLQGVLKLSEISDITVIIDILSFTTCVEIATNKGAEILPYQYNDFSNLKNYALENNAIIAEKRSKNTLSLSPNSLLNIEKNTKLILPSPNGSTLSLSSKSKYTFACCLRNYQAVAEYINKIGGKVAIIASGEKWEDNSLRPAIEDLLGAGALISKLKGSLSPESEIAKSVFESNTNKVSDLIKESISGQELIEKGYPEDVELATELNISNCVPLLKNNSYKNIVF